MKIIIASLVIFTVLFIFCTHFNSYLYGNIENILTGIKEIAEKVETSEFEEGKTAFLQVESTWKKKKGYLSLLIEHSELDKINELFAELSADFSKNEFNDFERTVSKLNFYLSHLIEKNKLNYETIL